ncbi:hypothetical protein HDU88_001412 [Geranomyces variabilis]|nr:hypothetical protein HDU88_001412 [Geranomyces variabilis]
MSAAICCRPRWSALAVLLFATLLQLAGLPAASADSQPVQSARQLNYTGIVNQPSMLAFQAISKSDDATYVLKWNQLAVVDGCRMRIDIAHQSMGAFVRACPEQFPSVAYNNDSEVFAVYPTLPFAGTYVINVAFTLDIPGLNVTVRPSQTTVFLSVAAGDAPAAVNTALDQRVLGQQQATANAYTEMWVAQNQVATLPQANQDPAAWNTDGTFRVVLNPGSGKLKTGLCRLFTVSYYNTNASAVDVPAGRGTATFQPYFGTDGQVFLTSSGVLQAVSTQTQAFRISDNANAPKWQPLCGYDQAPPAFENTTSRLAFGLYFTTTGTFNIFVQTRIGGYLVTSSHVISVPNPVDDAGNAAVGGGSKAWWLAGLAMTLAAGWGGL